MKDIDYIRTGVNTAGSWMVGYLERGEQMSMEARLEFALRAIDDRFHQEHGYRPCQKMTKRSDEMYQELLDRIMAFVEAHYTEEIRIGELSKQLFVSSSTVSHLFKEKMGVSFYRYVSQRRLIAAKTLIEKGQLLEDVAVQTGFADYSGFYRAFKQEYGISPRQYRNLQTIHG